MATAKSNTTKTTRKTTAKRPSAATSSSNVVPMNNDISAQLDTLRDDLKLLAKTVKEQAKTKLNDRTETARTVATEQKDAAAARYDELTTKAETQIREKPLTSMAIAVAAGLVLGAILRK